MHDRTGATHVVAWQAIEDADMEHNVLSTNLKRLYPLDPETRSTFVIYELRPRSKPIAREIAK